MSLSFVLPDGLYIATESEVTVSPAKKEDGYYTLTTQGSKRHVSLAPERLYLGEDSKLQLTDPTSGRMMTAHMLDLNSLMIRPDALVSTPAHYGRTEVGVWTKLDKDSPFLPEEETMMAKTKAVLGAETDKDFEELYAAKQEDRLFRKSGYIVNHLVHMMPEETDFESAHASDPTLTRESWQSAMVGRSHQQDKLFFVGSAPERSPFSKSLSVTRENPLLSHRRILDPRIEFPEVESWSLSMADSSSLALERERERVAETIRAKWDTFNSCISSGTYTHRAIRDNAIRDITSDIKQYELVDSATKLSKVKETATLHRLAWCNLARAMAFCEEAIVAEEESVAAEERREDDGEKGDSEDGWTELN